MHLIAAMVSGLAIAASASSASAQIVADASDLATDRWSVEYTADGDLSRDGVPDLVVVLKGTDPELIVHHDGLGENPYDSNPRRLVVALGEAGGFRVVADNAAVLSRRDSGTMDDPLQEPPVIENGVLKATLVSFMSAGGWGAGNRTFGFRWQDGGMRLIGYDRLYLHRGSGETETISLNLLTGRMSTVTGSIEDDEDQPPVWSRVRLPPIWLNAMGDGFAFEDEVLASEGG